MRAKTRRRSRSREQAGAEAGLAGPRPGVAASTRTHRDGRTSMHTLDQLNALSHQEFVAALDGVFEHALWVAEAVAAQRPFFSVIRLHEALMDAVRTAPDDVRLGFL